MQRPALAHGGSHHPHHLIRLRPEPAQSLDDLLEVLGPRGGHPPRQPGEVGVEPLDVVDGEHEALELVTADERVELGLEEREVQPLHLRPLLGEQLVASEGERFALLKVLPESFQGEGLELGVVLLASGLKTRTFHYDRSS